MNLHRIVSGFRKGILDGRAPDRMCAMVSMPLASYLTTLGVEAHFVEGEVRIVEDDDWIDHCWVALADGRIIDATASQFNGPVIKKMPAVYIGPLPCWYREPTE